MAPQDMSTTGSRLRQAIKEHGPRAKRRRGAGGSIRQFQERLAKKKALFGAGVSRRMIDHYLADRYQPPKAFLEAAAKILSPVREEWLATGEGAMTYEGEALRKAEIEMGRDSEVTVQGEALGSHPLGAAAMDGLMYSLPATVVPHLTFEYRQLSAAAVKVALALMARGPAGEATDIYRQAGRILGDVTAGLLTQLRVSSLDPRTARAYVGAIAHAVEIIAEYAGSAPESGEATEPQ